MIKPYALTIAFMTLLSGSVTGQSQTLKTAMTEPDVQRGLSFAKHNCARCHAIGRYGTSSLNDAPPFRDLKQRYPLEDLYESFSEGIMTGHPSMPVWRLEPDQIHDLIEYMKTL